MSHEHTIRAKTLVKQSLLDPSACLTVDQLFQGCVDHICEMTGWSVGHVYVPSQASNAELVSTSIWHLKYPERFDMVRQVIKAIRFPAGIGLPGEVWASGNPVLICDVQKNPEFFRGQLFFDLGIQAAFAFPAKGETGFVAVFEFFSEIAQEPNRALVERIEKITSEVALRVEQKRMELKDKACLQ